MSHHKQISGKKTGASDDNAVRDSFWEKLFAWKRKKKKEVVKQKQEPVDHKKKTPVSVKTPERSVRKADREIQALERDQKREQELEKRKKEKEAREQELIRHNMLMAANESRNGQVFVKDQPERTTPGRLIPAPVAQRNMDNSLAQSRQVAVNTAQMSMQRGLSPQPMMQSPVQQGMILSKEQPDSKEQVLRENSMQIQKDAHIQERTMTTPVNINAPVQAEQIRQQTAQQQGISQQVMMQQALVQQQDQYRQQGIMQNQVLAQSQMVQQQFIQQSVQPQQIQQPFPQQNALQQQVAMQREISRELQTVEQRSPIQQQAVSPNIVEVPIGGNVSVEKEASLQQGAAVAETASAKEVRPLTMMELALAGDTLAEDIMEDHYGTDIGGSGYADRDEKASMGLVDSLVKAFDEQMESSSSSSHKGFSSPEYNMDPQEKEEEWWIRSK